MEGGREARHEATGKGSVGRAQKVSPRDARDDMEDLMELGS